MKNLAPLILILFTCYLFTGCMGETNWVPESDSSEVSSQEAIAMSSLTQDPGPSESSEDSESHVTPAEQSSQEESMDEPESSQEIHDSNNSEKLSSSQKVRSSSSESSDESSSSSSSESSNESSNLSSDDNVCNCSYADPEVVLEVRSEGWGTILDTVMIYKEGMATLSIQEENPYDGENTHYAMRAFAAEHFTEIISGEADVPFEVDLDRSFNINSRTIGVIIGYQSYFGDCYISDNTLTVHYTDGEQDEVTTDSEGRYEILKSSDEIEKVTFTLDDVDFEFTPDSSYYDYIFLEPMQMAAPYIYLYPEEAQQVSVALDLILEGSIVVSDPAYGTGWTVTAEPSGLLDGKYPYLFYEANQAIPMQMETGWVIDGTDLSGELTELLTDLGLIESEIEDFLGFWLPVLEPSAYYAVFPQDIDSMVRLVVDPKPQTVIRVLLFMTPMKYAADLIKPQLPTVPERDGFTVVEWGVLVPPGALPALSVDE
ncbi:MAG: hypothetical protein OCD01_04710 [Fibrobacterales bacterium]